MVVWVVNDQTFNGSESGTSFKQALYAKECGFLLYDTMIYAKRNPTPKNHKRYEQSFEYMFVFSKGKPKTFNAILEKCSNAGKINKGTMRNSGRDELSIKHGYGKECKETKIKGNIWYYSVGGKTGRNYHPAIFPLQLAKDHILSWSNKGDVVFDPFMGSGTTGLACMELERSFIGCEKDAAYFSKCKEVLC